MTQAQQFHKDERFMAIAIAEAKHARERGDYFFGAVVARKGEILARGGNRVVTKNDSTKHIELEVIQYATGTQTDRYLTGCTLYTTAEPCLMCAGAMFWSGIRRVVWAMSQDDLERYGKEKGDIEHRYRPTPIRVDWKLLKKKYGVEVAQVFNKECLAAINNKK